MFPSTGLFRDVPCSFFLFGLCERPYCHFRHSRQDEARARIEAEKSTVQNKSAEDEYKPPASSLQRTLQEIENSIISEKRKLENNSNNVSQTGNVNATKTKPTGTPEYNPTPITELKKKKIESKLGRSKYDLALLEEPAKDGEYDPASNYSTGRKSAEMLDSDQQVEADTDLESLPVYAKQLHGTKRPVGESDSEEDESPLAKIPKFVSVDYTPAVNDSAEFSDEEPLAEKEDWFSGEGSEKGSENDWVAENISEKGSKSACSKLKENKEESKDFLPIEFTSDGFVKSAYIEKHGEKKDKTKSSKNKSKNLKDSKEKTLSDINKDIGKISKGKDKTESSPNEKNHCSDNIFSLFKEEFDNALESCDKSLSKDVKNSTPKVKLKSGDVSKSKSKSLELKVSKNNDSKPEAKSNSSDKQEGKKSEKIEVSSHKRKESSENNLSNHKTNGAVSDKHRHSSRKGEHSISKQKSSSSSSSKHRESSSSSTHTSGISDGHSSSRHSSSKSVKFSSHHSKDHKKSEEHPSKSDKGRHKHSHSSSKHHKHTESSATGKSSHSKSGNEKTPKKKKQIVNLDVDIFGVESDDDSKPLDDDNDGSQTFLGDDFSDLDKYFEDDPFEECLKIFNEEAANKPSTSGESERKKLKKSAGLDTDQLPVHGKKRIALKQSDPEEKKKTASNKPVPKPSPAQVMMNRYKVMQERILQAEQESKEKMKVKVRQISKQNAVKAATSAKSSKSNLASASATFTDYIANKNKKTSAITVTKGAKRKAHTPTVPIAKLKRPIVEVSSSSKVGTNVRQRYLNLFIDELVKIHPSEEEAFKRGKEEEEAVYKRCTNKKIYLNCAVNTIKRLRTEVEEKKSGHKKVSTAKKMSHATMLDGAGATKATYTLHRSGGPAKLHEEDFRGADLYKRLQPYILTEEQLKENNFPRPDPTKGGMAVFHGEERSSQKGSTKGIGHETNADIEAIPAPIPKGDFKPIQLTNPTLVMFDLETTDLRYEKLCVRCGKVFEVYPNGKYPVKEECVYHWGKAWKKKIAGSIETRYTCCQGDLSAEGCQVAKLHVHETNKKENMSGFMKTIPSSPPIDGDYGVYALDCEMVYTTMGVELARVTVVGADEEPVYESLVRPDNPVIDCNTRFSGITDDDLEDVTTSLRDVQAVLLSLFTDKTILMGHSLESDLTALKLIHNTVVDTSVVFPHRLGKPYKRALKNLMADYLKKIIQDDVAGHDSLEDAVACVQLMQYRLKEDSRTEGRRLSS